MIKSLFSKTPSVKVLDNRGLTVRDIAYHRHPDLPAVTNERITRYQYDDSGLLEQSADTRLHDAGLVNVTYLRDLTGSVLCTQSVDSGITIALNDAAGRPLVMVSNISTNDDGTDDRSQAVTRTWQYEDVTKLGRPLSVIERMDGEAARITERFVYAGNTNAEKALNLTGMCVSHYDTAGLVQTDSIGLNGVLLSVSRSLIKEADNPDVITDWQEDNTSAWNSLLAVESFSTLSTADAHGAVLSTTNAKGHVQRVEYNVAGLLSGSWLRVNGGAEQVMVKSLTYSAAGQKRREEHGNGVVTTYTYEPQTQRLIGIKTERPSGHASGAKVLQDLRYEYDPVGNVLNIHNDAEETRFWRNQKVVPENTYTYDSLYQLVSATGREMASAGEQSSRLPCPTSPLPTDNAAYTNYSRSYTYDSAGNLIQISHSSPAINNCYTTDITVSDRSNRGVLSTLTKSPSEVDALFTAGGQQKQLQPGQSLIWTPRNELLKVTPVARVEMPNDSESYRYDGSSQRILKVSTQKTNNSMQTQRVVYLPGVELRTTTSGSKEKESLQVITVGETGRAQVRVLHWESGRPTEITGDLIRYSYDNLIGSSQLELDGDGNIISMEEYYPYGGTAVWASRSAVEADYKTVRYSGKERDATGLYYYGYRYYQPLVGRWLSSDPAGTIDGLNLFRMCRNNPVMFADSDGLVGQPVAVYGLSDGRKEENTNIIASRDIPITIDQLNRNLGITESSYGIDKFPQIMENIDSGSRVAGASTIEGRFPKNEGNAGRLGVEDVLTIKWAKFLLQNIEKINVNKRITDKRSEHRSLRAWIAGDAKKIHQYAHKNLAPHYRESRDTKYYDNLFENASKGESLDEDAQLLLDSIATTDFFRQTSKLGIDFFIKERIPIHFTHSIGPNMRCFTHDEAMMKPYKKLNERQDADGDPAAYAEPVTFSEYRHATKRNSPLVTSIK
jgi:insecticidal toxin complex protein TccC